MATQLGGVCEALGDGPCAYNGLVLINKWDLDEHTLITMNTALVLSVVQSSCLNLSLLLPSLCVKCDGLSRGETQDVSEDTQIPVRCLTAKTN